MTTVLKAGIIKAWNTFLELIKIMIPVYILVILLKYMGIVNWLANLFSPLMRYIGLPGEAMLALMTSYLLNIYGGLAVILSLDVGPREITILGVMIGISHSLLIESAIFKKMKINLLQINLIRLTLSFASGFLLNLVL